MTTFLPSMSTKNEYSINWNYQQNQLLEGLKGLLGDDHDSLTDVTFACDGDYVHAHKVILSLCSSFFKDLFTKNKASRMNTIIILGNVSAENLRYLLQFIYQGNVDIPSAHVTSFLEAGRILKIDGLLGVLPEHAENWRLEKESAEPGGGASKRVPKRVLRGTEETTRATIEKLQPSKPVVVFERSDAPEVVEVPVPFNEPPSDGEMEETEQGDDPLWEYEDDDGEDENESEEEIHMDVKPEPIQVYIKYVDNPQSPDESLEVELGDSKDKLPVPVCRTKRAVVPSSSSRKLPSGRSKRKRKPQPTSSGKKWQRKTPPAAHTYYVQLPSTSGETQRKIYKCLVCDKIVKEYGRRTTNLIRHLNVRHPEAYEEVRKSIELSKQKRMLPP